MVKVVCSRMIRNLQFYGGSQDIQCIHALIMEQFGLMDNLMHQIMGKVSQILNISNGDPDTPTLNEAIPVPYKTEFIHSTTQDIKELE